MKIIILFCIFFVMVWSYPANEKNLPASIDNIPNTELVLPAAEIDDALETSESRYGHYGGGHYGHYHHHHHHHHPHHHGWGK
nr:uncharacterized histidine-rich protein DDB_G0274557-like isoform X2 [Onthophagus taurus]XP_022904460.1 uncharacterized histidine-rich protein DDB_G0274557-like isoform X3 [Onthophagus taurus]